ncbi:carbohydrate kinase family protein [Vibrio vulnificus]|uniref:carbohydrate kinase family protein n=1 Tax=Vibrio vulnificus TaxID=672 RepID=UPI001029D01A|nr:carbohydrate kinase family protein [Vibrio vulnificus]RZP73070.1 carbohydrate kinase family protein [Vibrio vulnificus]RZP74389.1 carbohydrate kinase family protein [Vibrio vulnificus]
MRTVACIGMAVADLIVGPVEQFNFSQDVTLVDNVNIKAGGDAANVALNLAVLETPVSLYTKLGQDLFGQWLVEHYQSVGVDTGHISQTNKESTGTAIALVDHTGERVFLYRGGTVDTLSLADIDVTSVMQHDMVHASGFFLLPSLEDKGLSEIFYTAHKAGKLTSLDVGWDSTGRWLETIKPILPSLTYFLPTLNEAKAISGCNTIEACAEFFIEQGVEAVVIKAGADGAFVNDGTTAYWVRGASVDKVVDTTGAGDGFVSGFLSAIARGYSLPDAVKVANNAGATVVKQYGSTGVIKSFEQINIKGINHAEVI